MCVEKLEKREHPNRLLRLFGNTLSAIGVYLIKISEPYSTWYEWKPDYDTCECPNSAEGIW